MPALAVTGATGLAGPLLAGGLYGGQPSLSPSFGLFRQKSTLYTPGRRVQTHRDDALIVRFSIGKQEIPFVAES
jgi:hypothetical protein